MEQIKRYQQTSCLKTTKIDFIKRLMKIKKKREILAPDSDDDFLVVRYEVSMKSMILQPNGSAAGRKTDSYP